MNKEKGENKEKGYVPYSTEVVNLGGTNEKIVVGFKDGGKIDLRIVDYSDKRKSKYPQSSGVENLPDARGQTLKFWYEKNPTTNELLWSIGINGLDENKLIKTKTMLINHSVFENLMKIGIDYFFKNKPGDVMKKEIENILNEKTGFGLSKYLLKHKVNRKEV